jgi:hypothetical protein
VFATDVDGDGDLDVLRTSRLDDKIAWFENDGSQNFTEHVISTAADYGRGVFPADVDSDGDLDVLSASRTDNKIAWYENLGNEGGGTPALSIDDVSLAEGDSGETDFTLTISIAEASASDVNVDFATADDSAAAPDDYTAISGTATIAAGATSTTVTIKVQGDTTVEPNEMFFVNLSNPVNATIDDNQGLGTIIDDDTDLATLSIDDVSQLEDGIFTFTITSDTAASSDITVVVNTADLVGQATAGSDYTAIVYQTATITAGSTSTTVTVTVTDDAIVEDNQTFAVNLSDAKIGGVTDPAQVVIGDGAGIGTIENNDTAVLTISNVTETETDSDFTVQATVTLSAEVEGGFDVAYSSALGTADATDITVQGNSLSFVGTAGETQTIDVLIIGDDFEESDETFSITLGDVTGTSSVQDAAITTGAVSDGLIIDDDTAIPTIDLDVDANGEATALTDGVLIVRSLFGVTGTQLTDGALGTGATRTDSVEIIAFLDGFLPAAASASLVVSTQDTLIANYDAPAVSRLETRSVSDGTVVLVRESSALASSPLASRHFDAMNVWFVADSSTFGNHPYVAFERSLDRRDELNWRLDTRAATSSPRLWPRTTVVESAPAVSDPLNGDSLSSGNEETLPEIELDEVFADRDQLFEDIWKM